MKFGWMALALFWMVMALFHSGSESRERFLIGCACFALAKLDDLSDRV